MKSDLDQLMKENNLEALLVRGPSNQNPSMAYFTGRASLTRGHLLKLRDQTAIIFHGSMERDEAALTGLTTRDLNEFNEQKLLDEAKGDLSRFNAKLMSLIFEEYGVTGRVSLYGKVEIGPILTSVRYFEETLPELELVGEPGWTSVLAKARATKDDEEVQRIRAMGEITKAVVADVASFLTSHSVNDGYLVKRDGDYLTVGEIKRKINFWLAMRGAENPGGTIFAIGHDAGVPHSVGKDDDRIPIGVPIVFDLFPCETGGKYYHDFTRTWCLDHAPDDVMKLHDDVLDVYEKVYSAMEANTPCREYQVMTNELFEEKGHPTRMSDPLTQKGYVHTLCHGIGLAIHEAPSFSARESNEDKLLPGSVITIEPGLYYPEKNMGIRIEDTVWVRPDGQLETLVDFPKDLVLELQGV